MNYLSVENATKYYGARVLFSKVSFGIDQGQKVALIAKNGTGKTTLLKAIVGLEQLDEGNITTRNDIKIGFLSQEQDFDPEATVFDIIYDSGNEVIEAIKAYEASLEDPNNSSSMEVAFETMNRLDAWDYEARIKMILSKLGLERHEQKTKSLSGGQKKRLALAKILIDQPDFMILDEPTNHLDLDMIEWLEEYLKQSKITLLMVTHDRYFLERICDEIMEIDRETLFRYKGNYSYFLEKKAEREELEQTNITKAKNMMRKELEWMRRQPKARGTKAKSRVDAFQDIQSEASKKIKKEQVNLDVRMERLGTKILELHKVSKSYDNLTILDHFNYIFRKGEKAGIAGKNGVGKSTFLKLIMGEEEPDHGKIVTGETVVFGYYSQEGLKLKEDLRVIEVVKEIADHIPIVGGHSLSASQMLERFLFTPEKQYTYVSTLSGGEKRRLYLLTILMKNPNFLILDEPTNDLDIYTLNVLEDYLDQFGGCVLVVTHDRYFLDKIAEHIFVFEGEGKVKDWPGKFSDYRAKEKATKKEEGKALKKEEVIKKKEEAPPKQKVKMSFKEKYEFEQLEKDIEALEEEKQKLTTELNDASLPFDRVQEISDKLTVVVKQLEEKGDRWLELSEYDL